MAATVGATLSGVAFPSRHWQRDPFISTAGNVYYFGRGTTNTGNATPMKASDPTSAFTAQTVKLMSSGATTAAEAMATFQVGQVIHVATQISTGQVFYNFYTMDTDTWGLTTSETAGIANTSGFAPIAGSTFVSLVVRSDGTVVFAFSGGVTAMSGTFNTCYYRIRTGVNTYGTATKFDNAGSVNWFGGPAVLGASDRVHFFFTDVTNLDSYHRTLSAANALQTFPTSLDNNTAGQMWAQGTSYVSGGTTKVRATYRGLVTGSHNPAKAGLLDSADAPTATSSTITDGTATPAGINNQSIVSLAADGTTLHALWSDSATSDLMHDSNANDAGWGTDTNEFTGTINRCTSNVYTRLGTKYLAMVLDDGGTIKYAEITLTAAVAAIHRRLISKAALVRSSHY